MEQLLNDVFYNTSSPACYAGASAVLKEARKRDPNVKLEQVEQFLAKQDAHTLHAPARKRFSMNQTTAAGAHTHYQADLADLSNIKQENDGYSFVLTCVDVFSRFAMAEPVKNKKPENVAEAFERILARVGKTCWFLATDAGKEFVGKPFVEMLYRRDIIHYIPRNDRVKCAVVERLNRTLKTRLWRLFTKQSNYRWLEHLQPLVAAINASINRTVGCSPLDVLAGNCPGVTAKPRMPQKFKYKVGDKVRISRNKHIFEKGYAANYSEEVFTVCERQTRNPPIYRLRDYNEEIIEGIFYEPELIRVVKEDQVFKIDKILRRRNKGKELFVSWKGYPASFNSWIKANDLVSTS